jgi:hypothetical protein
VADNWQDPWMCFARYAKEAQHFGGNGLCAWASD